jgi:hypothetical protein
MASNPGQIVINNIQKAIPLYKSSNPASCPSDSEKVFTPSSANDGA